MILLDTIIDHGDDWLEAYVSHSKHCLFADHLGRIPTWVGLEYICQAVAALEGIGRLRNGAAIIPGAVMGAKSLLTSQPYFLTQQAVRVRIQEEIRGETTLAVYSGIIADDDGQALVTSTVKVIMPEDPTIIFKGKKF